MTETIDRRNFLRLAGAAALAGCSAADSGPDGRPNIVIVMADDMGFSDIGPYGGEIDTPTLDYLAANGLRFTQFYNTARCCPTRAALLTGIYQHQAGVGHMVGDMGRPAYRGYLNDRCVTIAEALKPAGYTTLMSGKWHVGEERPHWPVDRGFDEGASNYFKLDGARTMALGNEPWTPPDDGSFYMTDAIADHAVEFPRQARRQGQPVPALLAVHGAHWPQHAKPADIAKYKGKYAMGWDALREQRYARELELGLIDEKWALSPRDPDVPAWEDVDNKPLWERRMEVYAAMIDCMDQGIGRVVDKIRSLGKLDNTLILFWPTTAPATKNARYRTGHAAQYLGRPERHAGRAGFVRRLRPAVGQRRQYALPHVQKLGA